LKCFKAPQDILKDDISAISEDREGTIFVGTLTGGVFKLSTKDRSQKFVPISYTRNISLNVRALMLDKQGRLFI
jgi:ligand-binding sensor domain-containing protein